MNFKGTYRKVLKRMRRLVQMHLPSDRRSGFRYHAEYMALKRKYGSERAAAIQVEALVNSIRRGDV